MLFAPVLIIAAALLQPEQEEVLTTADQPYRCSVPIEMSRLTGGMWRDFDSNGPDDFYKIQIYNPEVDTGPFATWGIDNRPPARPRVYGWDIGRPEAEVFRTGPDYVAFGTVPHGEVRDGRLSARIYGDGAYAGTIFVQRARATRYAHRQGSRAVAVSISQRHYPAIVAQLAQARLWEAVVVDDAGGELGRKSVTVPAPAEVEAAFNRARAELLRHREEFLRRPTWNQNKPCSTFLEELDAPI